MQLTPPGSPCSVIFGKGVTTAAPGSVQGLLLIVDDIEAARAELVGHGVDVSEVFHFEGGLHVTGTSGRAPGPDPEGRSYSSWASFSDPDGNGWLLQEIKTRLPGRGLSMDVATLTELLRETEERHGAYEATAPKHHWSEWYAAYIVARERGRTPEEAAKDAALHMKASASERQNLGFRSKPQLFAIAPRSRERLRVRGPFSSRRRCPHPAAFGRRPLPLSRGEVQISSTILLMSEARRHRLHLAQHRRDQLGDRGVDGHGAHVRVDRGARVHHVDDAVDGLVAAHAQDGRAQDLTRLARRRPPS